MPYADRKKQLNSQRNWNKKYYLENREQERNRIAKRKNEIAIWFKEFKSKQSCSLCKESNPVCLDFHHTNHKQKDLSFGNIKSWGWSKKRIESEINKCIIVCSNCHRKVHAKLNDPG